MLYAGGLRRPVESLRAALRRGESLTVEDAAGLLERLGYADAVIEEARHVVRRLGLDPDQSRRELGESLRSALHSFDTH